MSAPGILIDYDFTQLTPALLTEKVEEFIKNAKKILNGVSYVSLQDANYDRICKPLERFYRELIHASQIYVFPQHVHMDKDVRAAAVNAEKKFDELRVSFITRMDIFTRVKKIYESGMENLSPEQTRFVEKLILDAKHCGLQYTDGRREKVKKYKLEISDLALKFQSNIREEEQKLYFKREELNGLSEDLISSLPEDEQGNFEMTTKYIHLFPVIKSCKVPNTRKKMLFASSTKCKSTNGPVLQKLLKLRHNLATLMGFKNHVDYVVNDRMAKNQQNITNFLEELESKLSILMQQERRVMLELKEKESKELGFVNNGKIDFWDIWYYMALVEKEKYSVDRQMLRNYFPLERVTSGMFTIYQNLLGLRFNLLENVKAWHEDVKLYEVRDTDTSELLGYFFLDLHPRPGKYTHAAVAPLQPACEIEDGTRQVSVCAMLCNFPKATPDNPALLSHEEVVTYFHEFGHAMHNTCSRVKNAYFSGTRVYKDFVEAPSQMLENWVWQKETLSLMSHHHETQAPIPDDLLSRLTASRVANAGFKTLRQVLLAKLDQVLHSKPDADPARSYDELQKEIMDIDPMPGMYASASFTHMCGYDGQYYAYLWSQVFSMDMFAEKFEGRVLDTETGRNYRDIILAKGGSVHAMDLLVMFLGRQPNNMAFLKNKGLQS